MIDPSCEYAFGGEILRGEEIIAAFVKSDEDARNPLVCPLLASLGGLPPAFLAIAECDVLAEQNIEMAGRLLSAGVPAQSVVYPGASHSFI